MPTNFNIRSNVKSEQTLYENLVIESLKIYGQDCYYLPRTVVNENRVFGEDVPSTFDDAYKIEMYNFFFPLLRPCKDEIIDSHSNVHYLHICIYHISI